VNIAVEKTQSYYRNARKKANYSIFDIESLLEELAKRGFIWPLQGMQDLTNAEEILIQYFLKEYREKQVYDNLFNNHY